ncbi:MAG: ABC transporter substrate-binding protein [Bdellovibrionales bacterium]|nr:ABC transporter substrate-binding protein [Bdellovibrionales bacterium]
MCVRSALLLFLVISFASPSWAAKKFVYCSEGSPVIFNPQLATDGATNNAIHPIYNGLVGFIQGTTGLRPSLASDWTISDDEKQYTFMLRKDVAFHKTKDFKPTRNFNADDVLFSFNRQRLSDHPYHNVGGKRYEYFTAMGLSEIISDIQKVDDYTVKFILAKPDATFLANLAMPFASILSSEYADHLTKIGQQSLIDTNPVGTGPFVFQKYVPDTYIEYSAFDHYFRGKAKIQQLIFSIHSDALVRAQKLFSGECHLIAEPPPSELKRFERDPNIKVMKIESMNVGYLAFNVEKKPFDNVKVRQAIYHALNRQAYVDVLYKGLGVVAKNPLPPVVMGYHKDNFDYEYNPVKAKELLEQAGFKDGFTTELWALPVSRPYNPDGKKMAEMMQDDLAKVGIKAKIVTYDWQTYLAKTKSGEHTMCQAGWNADNGDPDNFMYTLLSCDAIESGANRARWCNKEFNQLVWDAKVMTDAEVRKQKYIKAQEIFKDQAPWVPIAHSQSFRAMQKNVIGFVMSPINRDSFYTVDLK